MATITVTAYAIATFITENRVVMPTITAATAPRATQQQCRGQQLTATGTHLWQHKVEKKPLKWHNRSDDLGK